MGKNVGSIDKIVRIIVGLALLSLLVLLPGNARWWGLIGLIPIVTALVGWCPGWALFGINTCSTRHKSGA